MRVAKRIAAVILSAALILGLAHVAHRCANFSAWIAAAFAYDNLVSLILAVAALRWLYRPVYDLLAYACCQLGLEPRFEGTAFYTPTPIALIPVELRPLVPKPTLRHYVFGYLLDLLFSVAFAYIWASLAVRCG